MALTEYRVWDRTQRVFHWANFLAVLSLAAIGTVVLNADRLGIPNDPGVVTLKTVHVYVGYVFILYLLVVSTLRARIVYARTAEGRGALNP